MNILLTGATGFLGNKLVKMLIEDGHYLYVLVRDFKKADKMLKKLNLAESNIQFIKGDISRHNLGIEEHTMKELHNKIDAVYHMAAFLSFDDSQKDKLFQVNYDGTKHTLEFAKQVQVKRFIHVSTAYTLGKREIGNEGLYPIEGPFTNYYEESKCHAEHLAFSYKNDFEVVIMRPAIIVGDSVTGEADSTFALYGVLRALKIFKKRIAKKGSSTASYRLLINPNTSSNFVPVDYVAKVLLLGLSHAEHGTIYNITNPSPPPHSMLYDLIIESLDFNQIELVSSDQNPNLTDEEKFLNEPIAVFGGYWNRAIEFTNDNTQRLLSSAGEANLEMDRDVWKRIIDGYYGVGVKKDHEDSKFNENVSF